MTAMSATEARRQFHQLLDEVSRSHEPVLITGKHANGVLISEDEWLAVQETLHLVSIPGMRESILEGMATPGADLEDELDW
jgi:prevent-host-death family protein